MPLDIDRLREAQGKPIWPRYPSEAERRWLMAHVDALDFLLSLAESGGRLAVEAPCEHGSFNPHYDGGSGLGCGGSSRTVVWPTEEPGGE